ncbi:MAG: hypothetical protein H7A01_17570 [Hahellaceae bacterium]|nr:hypothetical protein [Hahellaceae bacterium]MCP5212118.1 hypothetical protein [Hahellaceae bacterium]
MSGQIYKAIKIRHSISTKLLKIVLSIYFAVTLLVTMMHVLIEYDAAKTDVSAELKTIQRTFEDSLAQALWHLDKEQLSVTVAGITELPVITAVKVFDLSGNLLESHGEIQDDNDRPRLINDAFWHEFSLRFKFGQELQEIGKARIYSSDRIVFDRIKLGIVILIINAVIKTIVLFFLIIIVFDRLLTKPLGKLAYEAEQINPDKVQGSRIVINTDEGNELKVLEAALNAMMDKIVASLSELDALNKNLELKVNQRTESLNKVISELDKKQKDLKSEIVRREEKEKALLESRIEVQASLDNLKLAQNQLIEAEKMASLGGLVAGVAHEINTPVGLSLTGITHFQYLVERLEKRFKDGELEEEHFEKFMADTKELARSIHISLQRAADLVRSFKQVAVDQSHETIRKFNMAEYVEEVLISLRNRIKQTQIKVDVRCDPTLTINGYPGIWSQIITNLISNSLIHAYKPGDVGTIVMDVQVKGDKIAFVYSDDGKGMDENARTKIFDPFFTTNRENGGSGLGMNIIYNLVTQKMQGTIEVKSEVGIGTTFTILVKSDMRGSTTHSR